MGDRAIMCDAVAATSEVDAVARGKRLAGAPSAAPIESRLVNHTLLGIMFPLVVIPAGEIAREVAGSTLHVRFPAGNIEFSSGEVADVDRIASCSLLSPMFAVTDVAPVPATAEAALAELMLPTDGEEVVRRKAPQKTRSIGVTSCVAF
ncbi:[NiFe]-hydrogenase assembly chaperone HybE [Bradyrhizobium sp. UFLA05-153]